MANQDLQKVYDVMGLDHGFTADATRLNATNEGPFVLCFDADTCPLSKAEMHLNHCRACIQIYTTSAETLKRRISEANVKIQDDRTDERNVGTEEANNDEGNGGKEECKTEMKKTEREMVRKN